MATTTKKGELTRQKIFDASISLFTNKGYTQTTIKDICKEASISNGTFYHHFDSKQDILFEFVEYEQIQISKKINSYVESSLKKKIIKLTEIQYSYFRLKGKEFLGIFTALSITEPQQENIFFNYVTRNLVTVFLQEGEDLGQFKCFNSVKYVSDTLLSLFAGHIVSWASTKGQLGYDNLLTEFEAQTIQLIDVLLLDINH